jgi:hypothetical protein
MERYLRIMLWGCLGAGLIIFANFMPDLNEEKEDSPIYWGIGLIFFLAIMIEVSLAARRRCFNTRQLQIAISNTPAATVQVAARDSHLEQIVTGFNSVSPADTRVEVLPDAGQQQEEAPRPRLRRMPGAETVCQNLGLAQNVSNAVTDSTSYSAAAVRRHSASEQRLSSPESLESKPDTSRKEGLWFHGMDQILPEVVPDFAQASELQPVNRAIIYPWKDDVEFKFKKYARGGIEEIIYE